MNTATQKSVTVKANGPLRLTAADIAKLSPSVRAQLGIQSADGSRQSAEKPEKGSTERKFKVSWYSPKLQRRVSPPELFTAASKTGAIAEAKVAIGYAGLKRRKAPLPVNFMANEVKQNLFGLGKKAKRRRAKKRIRKAGILEAEAALLRARAKNPKTSRQSAAAVGRKNGQARYAVAVFNPGTSVHSNKGVFAEIHDAKARADSLVRNASKGVRAEVIEIATLKVVYTVAANPGTSAAKSPSGSKENPQQKFSRDTLLHLRRSFATIDGANVENHRAEFDKVFAGTSRPLLKQLAEGKIEWVSPLAKNALVARRNPAAKKNLHPLEIGSNIAMIIGGLDHVRTMMSRKKKPAKKKPAKRANSSQAYWDFEVRTPQRDYTWGGPIQAADRKGAAGKVRREYKRLGITITGLRVVRAEENPAIRKNLGLLDLVANLQAAEYITGKLKKKRNPNTPALQKIHQDFLGRENSGKVIKLYTPADAPKDVGAMARLVRITLANGRVQQFAKGSAWLGGYQRGSCRRMAIGLKQPFALPNGLDADKQHDYGEVKKIEYLAHKPHLYGDGSPEYLFFHPMGEEGGSRPHLVLDSGCLKLVGGSYKILREGISD